MTPEQRQAAEETLRLWREAGIEQPAAPVERADDEHVFAYDVQAYRQGRLEEIDPGLLEDQGYMAQVALAALALNGDGDTSYCLHCGTPLTPRKRAGRYRHYCDNKGKCKQAAHRRLERARERYNILLENAALCELWERHHIDDPLLAFLQEILFEQGRDAAQAATDAILKYASEQAQEKDEEIAQLERTISILKRQLDLEFRYFRDTQARGLISFLNREPAPSPLVQKILAHAQELPPMASHYTYEHYLRRKQICASEEELAEFKELWKHLMVEAAEDEYIDS